MLVDLGASSGAFRRLGENSCDVSYSWVIFGKGVYMISVLRREARAGADIGPARLSSFKLEAITAR